LPFWGQLPTPDINIFAAIKKGHNIHMTRSVKSKEATNTNTYEIQISYNGRHFVRIGQTASRYATEDFTAKYNYQHLLNQIAAGRLYFRIR
jgi:hypothetical protein